MGGAELWHLYTAMNFRDKGHQVDMILRQGPLAQKARENGLPLKILPMRFDLDLYTFLRAYLYFSKHKPDLALLNDQRECRVIAPAAAVAGVRVRVQRKGWSYLKGSWRDRLVYKYFVTHVISVSQAVEKLYRERLGVPDDRLAIFPNGVDFKRFENADGEAMRKSMGVPGDSFLIGSAGRLVSQKGFDVLIRATAILKDKGLEPWVAIAGTGEQDNALRELAEICGVEDRLVMPGFIDDMPSFLDALDLFAFPSRQEGRSNALTEAMASGLPVVASDDPSNMEIVSHGKTGLIVPVGDHQELASSIERIMNDPVLARSLGKTAKEHAMEFLDYNKIMDELESYLLKLAGR